MKGLFPKILASCLLLGMTIVAYGACFHGWLLPTPLNKPVSLREGSTRARTHGGRAFYFIGGGRSHYGGGYRGGK